MKNLELVAPHHLVLVPCGSSKIWSKEPTRGRVEAANAYTGTPFKLNQAYAERFGNAWMILSAKYGFIAPDFIIPGPYEVTFNRHSTNPVSIEILRQQVQEMQLDRFQLVVGLGGRAYREAISSAFADTSVRIVFPFAGLPIGRMMQATRFALDHNNPGFERVSARES